MVLRQLHKYVLEAQPAPLSPRLGSTYHTCGSEQSSLNVTTSRIAARPPVGPARRRNNALRQPACVAGVRISRGRMIAAAIASRHNAANARSIIEKPPWSYSQATRPTDAPAAVKPTK